MSLYFGNPCGHLEWRAEDIKEFLRPEWPLQRCQEELEAVGGLLRAKLLDVGRDMLNAMLSPDGSTSASAPALCADCIAQLALPVPEPRKLNKELRTAKRIVGRTADGRMLRMGINEHSMERWLAGSHMLPLESPLYFALTSLDDITAAGFGLRMCDLDHATPVSDNEWRLADGRELRVIQQVEASYRVIEGNPVTVLQRAA